MNRLSHLTKDITSYDLLKTFAVIFMIIDHTGYYFFQDDNWWRVAGRLCVPVWFFLIGYARSRDLGLKMWVGMGVLVLASCVSGGSLLPLNILTTMLVIRFVIDPIMMRVQMNHQALWPLSVCLLFMTFPTSYLFEYGSLAIIMAMFGWLVRHQHEYPGGVRQTQAFFFFAYASFVVMQVILFGFKDNQIMVLAGGILAVMCVLMAFRPVTFAGTGDGMSGVLWAPVRFMGRWTLEIYVVHLVVFHALGAIFFPERFPLFDWKILPERVVTAAISGVN